MNRYVKSFFCRGAIFGGAGPVILGIVYAVLDRTVDGFSLSGKEVLIATVSTYLLAFIHAGASVFNQIDEWPIAKSLVFHFGSLYLAYLACYAVNRWIPFEISVVLIFTAIFAACYFAVWLTVFFVIKLTEKRLNEKINSNKTAEYDN